MKNVYEHISTMRIGMQRIGRTTQEIEDATNDVTESESYEEALTRIKKYWI